MLKALRANGQVIPLWVFFWLAGCFLFVFGLLAARLCMDKGIRLSLFRCRDRACRALKPIRSQNTDQFPDALDNALHLHPKL